MKRLLALILIVITLAGFTACAKKAEEADNEATVSATEEALDAETETEEKAEADAKVDDAKVDEADKKAEANEKEVYWATENKDSSDVWYHTKDCDMIKDKAPDVLPWEIINALGMTACEKCNP